MMFPPNKTTRHQQREAQTVTEQNNNKYRKILKPFPSMFSHSKLYESPTFYSKYSNLKENSRNSTEDPNCVKTRGKWKAKPHRRLISFTKNPVIWIDSKSLNHNKCTHLKSQCLNQCPEILQQPFRPLICHSYGLNNLRDLKQHMQSPLCPNMILNTKKKKFRFVATPVS